MTLEETGGPIPEARTRERFRAWRTRPASVTNGRLLASRCVWTLFLALSAYVGVRQIQLDNQVTQDKIDGAIERDYNTCIEANNRRAESQDIAYGFASADQKALDSDRASWESIDALFPAGIPEPARTTVFSGLDARQSILDALVTKIGDTYEPIPCDELRAAATSQTD